MAPVLRHCPCLRPESEDVRLLDYSHSNLDDVPNEVFGYERTLEELCLDANQIKDLPRPLFHCHGLRKLSLCDNEIQTLPSAIASLVNLEHLDISKNGVLAIPDSIKGCKCLTGIDASVNPLGKLPEGVTFLLNLHELYLNDTFLEYLPANFGRLAHLRILELRENHLKLLPKSMSRLVELCRLDIGQNDMPDLPEVIGNLPRLVELWCDCNNLNCLPPFLGGLKKLAYLDASKNKIYEVAEEIEGCISLCDLTLSSNRIKVLPDGIANLRKLTVLRVDENRMVSVPENIGNLSNLEELVLSSNNLKSLPPSLGLLRNLRTLIADDNLLEELPCEIGSCLKLTILSLRDNKLLQIPDELGHITALKVINLSGNLLQYLPFSVAKLPHLQALWLSENQNKPLIPLQSDTDRMTGQKVLTCFMLPQAPLEEEVYESSQIENEIPEGSKGRHIIKFAFDAEKDRPSRLVRAPTPYPKELKAHARHARNYALKKQGSKDSEGNETAELVQALVAEEGLNATGATPDIMIHSNVPAYEPSSQVKEAAVVKPLASPKHERHYIQTLKDSVVPENGEVKPHTFLEQNSLQMTHQMNSEMIAAEITAKVLGRRDSRGDGSSSTGSPKLTPDGSTLEQGYTKKMASTTKKDTWMRQRLLKQGSGDSDRGYRSDHEVYLCEKDQYGSAAYHDGYASDWEAFLAKQVPEPASYIRNPPEEVVYRGRAEGQEFKSEGGSYAVPSEEAQNYGGYWQMDPTSGHFYSLQDMSHSYPPATDSTTYMYPGTEIPQPQPYYEDFDGYKHISPQFWPRPAINHPNTRRLGSASPRMKRAQCLSVQAPLHGSPQEYHLMPSNPRMPNTSPRPGRSPSPGMQYSQQPVFQYPITSQPVPSAHFPPPSSSMYHHYPTMPRLKQTMSYGESSSIDDSALLTRPHPAVPSDVQPIYYASEEETEYRMRQEYGTLQYRAGSIPAQIHNLDESSFKTLQHQHRSVPSINIIPSTSPPYTTSYSDATLKGDVTNGSSDKPAYEVSAVDAPDNCTTESNSLPNSESRLETKVSNHYVISPKPDSEETVNVLEKQLIRKDSNSSSDSNSNFRRPTGCFQAVPVNIPAVHTSRKKDVESNEGITNGLPKYAMINNEISNFNLATQDLPLKDVPSSETDPDSKRSSYVEGIISNLNRSINTPHNELELDAKTIQQNSIRNQPLPPIPVSAKSLSNESQKIPPKLPVKPGYAVQVNPNSSKPTDRPPAVPLKNKTSATIRNIVPNPAVKDIPPVPKHTYDHPQNLPHNSLMMSQETSKYALTSEAQDEIAWENNKNTKITQHSTALSSTSSPKRNPDNGEHILQEPESRKPCSSDKRFQKVLPSVDTTFQLKPCAMRKSPVQFEHEAPDKLRTSNSPTPQNVVGEPPQLPPKRSSMCAILSDGSTKDRSNLSQKTPKGNLERTPSIDKGDEPVIEDNINKVDVVQSQDKTDNKRNDQLENMPDLLSRIISEEKNELIIMEQGGEEDELSKDNFIFGKESNPPDSPKRQSWFFGTHRNSLVFPVIVSRNPEFGFSIEGGIGSPRNPYDNGIYVSDVIMDGPACNLLKPGDKILQVDGKDFTQLDHNKAVALLQESGATISLMVSRQ